MKIAVKLSTRELAELLDALADVRDAEGRQAGRLEDKLVDARRRLDAAEARS